MAIRVWLPEPDSVELMGGLPAGMTADVWTGGEQLPDSADEVEVMVLPFGVPPSRMPVLSKLPRLRLIQLMSAGAEQAIPFVPPGVTLCNARGVHDPAVAEWALAVILAQVRQLPERGQQALHRLADRAVAHDEYGRAARHDRRQGPAGPLRRG